MILSFYYNNPLFILFGSPCPKITRYAKTKAPINTLRFSATILFCFKANTDNNIQ